MHTRTGGRCRWFWLAWPLVTLVGLGLAAGGMLDLLMVDGQTVNTIQPPPGLALASGMQLGQTFVAARAGLERIDVLMFGYYRHNTHPVTFHLRLAGSPDDLVRSTFPATEVWGWRWMSFSFPALDDSAGRAYFFYFDSPESTPGDALSLGGVEGDLYPRGSAVINGQPARADAAFKTAYAGTTMSDAVQALSVKLTQHKPSLLGALPFYLVLGAGYLMLVAGLGLILAKFSTEG